MAGIDITWGVCAVASILSSVELIHSTLELIHSSELSNRIETTKQRNQPIDQISLVTKALSESSQFSADSTSSPFSWPELGLHQLLPELESEYISLSSRFLVQRINGDNVDRLEVLATRRNDLGSYSQARRKSLEADLERKHLPRNGMKQSLDGQADSANLIWPIHEISGDLSPWRPDLGSTQNLASPGFGELSELMLFNLEPTSTRDLQISPTPGRSMQDMHPLATSSAASVDGSTSLLFTGQHQSRDGEGTTTSTSNQDPPSTATQSGSTGTTQTPTPTSNSSSNLQCQDCSRVFSRRSDFKKHVDRHSKPYICQCGRSFGSFADLDRHKRTVHQRDGMFVCGEPTCKYSAQGQGFQRKEHLEAHIKRKGHQTRDGASPSDTASEQAIPSGKKRRFAEVNGESTAVVAAQSNPAAQQEVDQLKTELAETKTCCEELMEEIEKLKERHEEERRTLMKVINRLTKDWFHGHNSQRSTT